MADFRVDTGFFTHIKTKRLKRALGLEGVFALQMLWAYAAANKHDETRVYSEEDIELAVDWDGQPGSFVDALVDIGFLDVVAGGFLIHEWKEHNGFAASAGQRSDAGRAGANARWEKEKKGKKASAKPSDGESDAVACEPQCESQCESDAVAMRLDANRNAPSPSPSPSPSPEQEKREAYASCPEPSRDSAPPHAIPPDETPVFLTIPLRGLKAGEFPVTEAMISEWEIAFPAVDIRQQLRNIRQWNMSHPTQQKTRSGVGKHIVGWLVKEQDKGGRPQLRCCAAPGAKLERTISNMQEWLSMQEVQQ